MTPSQNAEWEGMDVNSIAALGTAMSQQSLSGQVSMRVARKTLDAQQQQGDAAVAMLDAATKLAQELAQKPAPGRLDVTA